MKFFFKSNFSLNTVKVAQPLLKSNVNVDKSFQYDDFAGYVKNVKTWKFNELQLMKC